MTLHTVGPASMQEDEHKIGDQYQTWMVPILAIGPFVLASYVPDIKWLVAAGIAVVAVQLHESGGRLHDLCIRLRRTNILLSNASSTRGSGNDS